MRRLGEPDLSSGQGIPYEKALPCYHCTRRTGCVRSCRSRRFVAAGREGAASGVQAGLRAIRRVLYRRPRRLGEYYQHKLPKDCWMISGTSSPPWTTISSGPNTDNDWHAGRSGRLQLAERLHGVRRASGLEAGRNPTGWNFLILIYSGLAGRWLCEHKQLDAVVRHRARAHRPGGRQPDAVRDRRRGLRPLPAHPRPHRQRRWNHLPQATVEFDRTRVGFVVGAGTELALRPQLELRQRVPLHALPEGRADRHLRDAFGLPGISASTRPSATSSTTRCGSAASASTIASTRGPVVAKY